MKNFFCEGITALALACCTCLSAQIKPLNKGDSIPEELLSQPFEMVNDSKKRITLSEYKDKLVLLDFWATWCSSCLKNFSKMEMLEKKFGNQLKILPVTTQSKVVLDKFYATANGKKYTHVSSILEGGKLKEYFPHNAVPYIVWIKNGEVLFTTDSDQVTEENLAELLQGKESSLQSVVFINKERPLLLSEIFDNERGSALQAYSFLAKGRIRGLSFGTYFHRTTDALVFGRQFSNLSLMEIYRAIGSELFYSTGANFSSKRVINEVRNIKDFDFDTTNEGKEADSKIYSIDFIVPKSEAGDLYPRMLNFLNENTPYHAVLEDRPVNCLVLKRSTNKDKLATKGGAPIKRFFKKPSHLQNVPLEELVLSLNANNVSTSLFVVDETGYKGNVDLTFSDAKDLETLKKDLAKYDLVLEESVRRLRMLIIKDDKN